jgi:hypothetical protein
VVAPMGVHGVGMLSADRPTTTSTLAVLRRRPQHVRAVVALGLFSVAEHAAWVTFLVVAYERGGVREAGIVSAMLLVPAALVAPLVANEVSGLGLRHPLAVGYMTQCVALGVAGWVAAANTDPVVFYGAAVLTTVTTVFSRPAHHGAIASGDDEATVAANVATGFVSGLAQLLGPLMASAVLLRFGVVEVFAIGVALLAVATTLTVGIGVPDPMCSDTAEIGPVWPPHRPTMREVLLDAPDRDARGNVVLPFCLLGLTTVVLGVVETLATDIGYGTLGDGGAGTGALIAAAGGGLLAGTSVAGVVLRRCSERTTMRLGACVTGAALLLCSVNAGLVWAAITFATVGAGMQMIVVAGWVLLHRHVRPAATCVVFGLLESQQLLGNALGAAVAGVAIARLGVWAVVASSALVLSASMLFMTAPRAHRLALSASSRVA